MEVSGWHLHQVNLLQNHRWVTVSSSSLLVPQWHVCSGHIHWAVFSSRSSMTGHSTWLGAFSHSLSAWLFSCGSCTFILRWGISLSGTILRLLWVPRHLGYCGSLPPSQLLKMIFYDALTSNGYNLCWILISVTITYVGFLYPLLSCSFSFWFENRIKIFSWLPKNVAPKHYDP